MEPTCLNDAQVHCMRAWTRSTAKRRKAKGGEDNTTRQHTKETGRPGEEREGEEEGVEDREEGGEGGMEGETKDGTERQGSEWVRAEMQGGEVEPEDTRRTREPSAKRCSELDPSLPSLHTPPISSQPLPPPPRCLHSLPPSGPDQLSHVLERSKPVLESGQVGNARDRR